MPPSLEAAAAKVEQDLPEFRGLLSNPQSPWLPACVAAVCVLNNSEQTQMTFRSMTARQLGYLLSRRYRMEKSCRTTFNSFLMLHNRLCDMHKLVLEGTLMQSVLLDKEQVTLGKLRQNITEQRKEAERLRDQATSFGDLHFAEHAGQVMGLLDAFTELGSNFAVKYLRGIAMANAVNIDREVKMRGEAQQGQNEARAAERLEELRTVLSQHGISEVEPLHGIAAHYVQVGSTFQYWIDDGLQETIEVVGHTLAPRVLCKKSLHPPNVKYILGKPIPSLRIMMEQAKRLDKHLHSADSTISLPGKPKTKPAGSSRRKRPAAGHKAEDSVSTATKSV